MLAGAYFLGIAPGVETGVTDIPQVANLQRLAIGETSAVVGAIFLAAAIRPRLTTRIAPESPPDRHTSGTGETKPFSY